MRKLSQMYIEIKAGSDARFLEGNSLIEYEKKNAATLLHKREGGSRRCNRLNPRDEIIVG